MMMRKKSAGVKNRDLSHYLSEKPLKIEGEFRGNCAVRVENALNALDSIWAKCREGEVDS